MTQRIARTLGALLKVAKFGPAPPPKKDEDIDDEEEEADEETKDKSSSRRLRPEFHYNIQVHLPANATEETYVSIFEAVRKVFR
jgi:hypothetical protein